MIALIQRVNSAQVDVAEQTVGKISKGILLLLGVDREDTEQKAKRLAERILSYRIFPDQEGKMNLNVEQAVLPQATLLALTFIAAAILGCLPWLAIGTLVGRYMRGNRARAFNYVMAALLIVSVVPMML